MKNYWLIGGAAILGLLIVVSVVVAIMQSEAEFDPGSPEAAVQAYLRALYDDDFQSAYDALSPELQAGCSIEDMFGERALDRWLENRRITLEEARTLGDTTFITVRISGIRGGGPFGPSEYGFDDTFALRQFDGDWRLSKDPWPHFRCARATPSPPALATPQPTAP